MDDRDQQGKRVFGEAMQSAMKARGCDLTLEDSQQLARQLLHLVDIGALVSHPAEDHEVELSQNDATSVQGLED